MKYLDFYKAKKEFERLTIKKWVLGAIQELTLISREDKGAVLEKLKKQDSGGLMRRPDSFYSFIIDDEVNRITEEVGKRLTVEIDKINEKIRDLEIPLKEESECQT